MTQKIITEHHTQIAFDWLSENSEHVAAKRVAVMAANRKREALERKLKRVNARLCLASEGSNDVRKWKAICHKDYEDVEAEIEAAEIEIETRTGEWETVLDRRNKCELVIAAWQTQEASSRKSRF